MKKDKYKYETNPNIIRKLTIRRIIKENGACLICIRRWTGKIKKYITDC